MPELSPCRAKLTLVRLMSSSVFEPGLKKRNECITIRLSVDKSSGANELFLTKTHIKRIQKAESMKKRVDLKISKTQISNVMKKGGSLPNQANQGFKFKDFCNLNFVL